MPRLPLLLCILALLGSAVSAGLFFQIGNSKQVLEQRLTDAGTRATKLDADLARANELNGTLKARVATLQSSLDDTQSRLAAAEDRTRQVELNLTAVRSDLSDAKAVVTLYELTARALADDVKALRQDLEASQASHASPDAVAAYKATIAELERQLATARNGAAVPATTGGSTAVFTSRVGRATVLSVGPGNAFVVLNFGSARGAQLGHKLIVSQGPQEIATVLISDVRANFSVAQVLPDTLRGVLQKGDLAVLIR